MNPKPMMPRSEVQPCERVSQVGTGSYPTLVLVEGEADMWLAWVRFDEPPQPGCTFHFRGTVWELSWAGDAGAAARPAAM